MDDKGNRGRSSAPEKVRVLTATPADRHEVPSDGTHVVFDFTGLHRLGVTDLALIVTARLKVASPEGVWVRELDDRTERILRGLGLAHLFRRYPSAGVLN